MRFNTRNISQAPGFPGLSSFLRNRNMATASKIHLSATQIPQYRVENLSSESAQKASELLQINHEKHHVFFNQDGFHNHIAHHLLTLFALGGTPTQLQTAYDDNATYQRAPEPLEPSIVTDMHDPARFTSYLGQEQYYHDFLVFFRGEIDSKGWETVLQEYLFAETSLADDMLVRLYAGFLHPLIHLGFGVEFEQPGIIAEALAQTAVHDAWMKGFFVGCEEKVRERGGKGAGKTIVQVLEECRADEKVRSAARESDANKIRDGILKRAPREMIDLATQCFVSEGDDVEEKTAEMINAADFFYMHSLNASIFFPRFLSLSHSHPAIFSPSTTRRLLNYKIWSDIVIYVSRGCPPLLLTEISHYKAARPGDLQDVIERVKQLKGDDGHAVKLVGGG
ncbi:hypothetical protein GMOD_00004303 [Pyrenophora seminiperda CCB06]|uniref:HypA-like protein n=1 Tax=Pyrenophora seminiperda CCB06 TaxID=1302712 RepID=A0A3M7M121_9PLEO|nr:hypothetical protein GMOD_00004303 [Pyrenophora seminiperda CCB06]